MPPAELLFWAFFRKGHSGDGIAPHQFRPPKSPFGGAKDYDAFFTERGTKRTGYRPSLRSIPVTGNPLDAQPFAGEPHVPFRERGVRDSGLSDIYSSFFSIP